MNKLLSFLLIVIALLAIIGTISWLEKTKPEPVAELQTIAPLRVAATQVIQGDVRTSHTLTGRLIPARRAALHFELSGLIADRPVEAGQSVREGDQLLRLADQDERDRLAEAQLALQQEREAAARDLALHKLTRQQRQLLDKELGRQQSLSDRALVPQSKLDETRRALITARVEESRLQHSVTASETRIQRSQLEVQKAERDLARTQLLAPFDGKINQVNAELGEFVTSGQVVVQLVDTAQLDLLLNVSGRLASALSLEQELDVTLRNSELHRRARLIALQPDPDPQTHTHLIRLRLSGQGLYAGQLADVVLTEATQKNALQVPVSAVLQENNAAFVYLIEQGNVIRTPVSLLGREGDFLIIEGVQAGQVLVKQDVAALTDGQKVSVIEP